MSQTDTIFQEFSNTAIQQNNTHFSNLYLVIYTKLTAPSHYTHKHKVSPASCREFTWQDIQEISVALKWLHSVMWPSENRHTVQLNADCNNKHSNNSSNNKYIIVMFNKMLQKHFTITSFLTYTVNTIVFYSHILHSSLFCMHVYFRINKKIRDVTNLQ